MPSGGKIYCAPSNADSVLVIHPGYGTCTTVGNLGTGKDKWKGGFTGMGGRLYCVPASGSSAALAIEPSGESSASVLDGRAATALCGVGHAQASGWFPGLRASDDRFYMTPQDAGSVLVLDPKNHTTKLIGAFGNGTFKWSPGVFGLDGRLYCAPVNAPSVLVVDPVAQTASMIGPDFGLAEFKWLTGVRADDGKIYCAPLTARSVLVIDPMARSAYLLGEFGDVRGKWCPGVLGPDRNIYCSPYHASSVLVVNPLTQAISTVGDFGDMPHKWDPGTVGSDGRLYFPPANASELLVVDPLTYTYVLLGNFGSGEYKWNRGVRAIDGVLYFAPWNAASVLVVDPLPVWSPGTHRTFPSSHRRYVRLLLLGRRRHDCVLHMLPHGLLISRILPLMGRHWFPPNQEPIIDHGKGNYHYKYEHCSNDSNSNGSNDRSDSTSRKTSYRRPTKSGVYDNCISSLNDSSHNANHSNVGSQSSNNISASVDSNNAVPHWTGPELICSFAPVD